MPQSLIEKIAQKFAVGLPKDYLVHSGDYISISPSYVMTHDNTGAVIPKFKSIGAKKFFNPNQIVSALDHNVQDKSEKNLEKYKKIEEFITSKGADFYPAGRGIGHQIMCEEGYAFPGTMVVASDSHSNMYGGLGCLGTPIVRTDAAAIWATGRTWWQIPPLVKVNLTGKLRSGASGKDVIIALCGFFNKDEVLNHAIEFSGDGVSALSIDERLAIANMTTEWGAMAGVFPVDDVTVEWLNRREEYLRTRGLPGVSSDALSQNGENIRINHKRIEELTNNIPSADTDAHYSKIIDLDLATIAPYISGPNSVKMYSSLAEANKKDIKINKAYLVSCVNSRLDDIAVAAEIVKGKSINENVKFYVAAASKEVQDKAIEKGYWQTLIESGAVELPPGCGPCIGLGEGLLEDNEVGISATNRNFKGRMGSPNALAYLASPAVVAYSALEGKIYFPDAGAINVSAKIAELPKPEKKSSKVEILKGFPEIITSEIIYCYQDNINTDGIYPGKYTYNDDFTPEQQAGVVMENYDPEFRNIAEPGNILASGFNFGTGSSREQAATALKYKGISLVIAGSFNETYKRNALNNGYLLVECPELIRELKLRFGAEKLTVKTGLKAEVNFVESSIYFDNKVYSIDPVGIAAQELILESGLENWVAKRL